MGADLTEIERAARREYMRQWRKNNPEKARAIDKASKTRNRDKVLSRKAKYRKDNISSILDYNREYNQRKPEVLKSSRKKWLEKNPHFKAETSAMRRVIERKAVPKWADLKAISEIYQKCAAVSKETGVAHHVDHIIPLRGKNVCGLHVAENLQILSAIENCRKSNKFIGG
jgi:hypothetical protein